MYQTHHTLTKHISAIKIDGLTRNEKYIILGDFNAKVENNHPTISNVVGKFGVGNSNTRGTAILRT